MPGAFKLDHLGVNQICSRYHPDYPWYGQCVTFGAFPSRSAEFLYFLLGMLFLYALPLLVILVTWGGIVVHLHRVSKFGHAMDESDEAKGALRFIDYMIGY